MTIIAFFIHLHSAAGNDIVNVWMKDGGIAPPSMQHAEESDHTTTQRLCRRCNIADAGTAAIEQTAVAFTLMNAQHTGSSENKGQFTWDRERDQKMMHRHYFGGLFFNPQLRFLVTTIRTMPIATRTPDPVFSITIVALVMHATKRAGTATRDCAQDFLLDDRDRLGMFFQVCWCELP